MKASPAQLAFPAALISFVAPGFGHFLIRAWLRGAIWLAGWLFLGALTGTGHSPVVVVLMLVAAIDAYLLARSGPAPEGSAPEGAPDEGR